MEILILYLLIFFSGQGSNLFYDFQGNDGLYSIIPELYRFIFFILPSLALIWYLLSDRKGLNKLKEEKPKKQDIPVFFLSLGALILNAYLISLLMELFKNLGDIASPPQIQSPQNLPSWIMVFLSCMGIGYLEESFFRYYLLNKLEKVIPGKAKRVFCVIILFSICHIYAGPWSVLNAAIAGLILSIIFLRFKTIHGLAIAHGLYNFLVYLMNT